MRDCSKLLLYSALLFLALSTRAERDPDWPVSGGVPAAQGPSSVRVAPLRDNPLPLPPEAAPALEKIYSGDPDGALPLIRQLQQRDPRNPLGYILEAEVLWWKIYCASSSVKWGMVNAWKRGVQPGDAAYLAILDREIALAGQALLSHDSAEMHLYSGIGLAMKAQLYALQGQNRATAKTAVAARSQFLHALQLNPNLADADTGLGLYNYYVDTLAPIVKILRWMMGIPGGNREEGIRQLERGMKDGQLTSVEARFYLAINLRTYDHDYRRALDVAQPLVVSYPRNPLFLLLVGNLQQELGRRSEAVRSFDAARAAPVHDHACALRIRAVAQQQLAASH